MSVASMKVPAALATGIAGALLGGTMVFLVTMYFNPPPKEAAANPGKGDATKDAGPGMGSKAGMPGMGGKGGKEGGAGGGKGGGKGPSSKTQLCNWSENSIS